MTVKPETTRRAHLMQVIHTVSIRGDGDDDPIREVHQFWAPTGELLAENDPMATNHYFATRLFESATPP